MNFSFKKSSNNIMKQKAIIIDLDNVIVRSEKRFERINLDAYADKDKERYIQSILDYSKDCDGDEPIDCGIDLMQAIVNLYKPDKVFFITARGVANYIPTLQWLKDENIWDNKCSLIMRDEKLDLDHFEFTSRDIDANYKKLQAIEIMQNYDILMAVDDSIQNCEAFVSLGIPTIHFIVPGLGRALI